MTHFVIQQHGPAASPANLSRRLREMYGRWSGGHFYALLDGAHLTGLARDLSQLTPKNHTSLFQSIGKPDLEAEGPWCVRLDMAEVDLVLDYACQAALSSYGVIWFASDLALQEVVPLLASRMDAKLERGPYVHFRYYDPRTFTELARLLKPTQSSFLSFATCWLWLDHEGDCRSLEMPQDVKAAKAFESPLTLDSEQEKAFLRASLPYEVMSILEENAPHMLEGIPRMKRYPIFKAGVDEAQAEGKHRLTDLATTCLTKLGDMSALIASQAP